MTKKFNEDDGVWRTISGRRVFIKEGQSLSDAMKESGKFKTQSKKGKTNKYIEKNKKLEEMKKMVNEQYEKDITDARMTGNDKLEESAKKSRTEQLRDIEKLQKENRYEYNLYKQAMENPDSIDPMTENSTDWEALERKYGDRYKKEINPIQKMANDRIKEKEDTLKNDRAMLEGMRRNGIEEVQGWTQKDFENRIQRNEEYLKVAKSGEEQVPRAKGSRSFEEHGVAFKDNDTNVRFSDYLRDRYGTDDIDIITTGSDKNAESLRKEFNQKEYKEYVDKWRNDDEYLKANNSNAYLMKMTNEKTKGINNTSESTFKKMYELYMSEHKNSDLSLADFKKWFK